MNYEKILRGILSKAYKLDAGQIDELIAITDESELETKLLDADKTRIAALEPKKGQTFADGYKKAKAEVLTETEKAIKEKFGVDTDVTGIDSIIDLVIADKTAAGDKSKLTDDDVKKHPAYQAMEKDFKKQLTLKDTELTEKLTAKEKEINRSQTLGTVKGDALKELLALNPIFPKNAKVADNLKSTYLKALEGYDFDIQDTGTVIMKDGKVVTDGHGHSMTLTELAKNLAGEYFEFENNNGGSNGGNNNNDDTKKGGAGAYPANITKPTNIAELSKILNDESIAVADRMTVSDVWETENSK